MNLQGAIGTRNLLFATGFSDLAPMKHFFSGLDGPDTCFASEYKRLHRAQIEAFCFDEMAMQD